ASEEAWSVGQIGHALLTTYNLVFEALSLVLLLAIIGAILIARKDTPTP
ncbi:MAG: NADH-quinone oxidoreductase subunit J, partial [Candidatus Latescibacterota bacterium]